MLDVLIGIFGGVVTVALFGWLWALAQGVARPELSPGPSHVVRQEVFGTRCALDILFRNTYRMDIPWESWVHGVEAHLAAVDRFIAELPPLSQGGEIRTYRDACETLLSLGSIVEPPRNIFS